MLKKRKEEMSVKRCSLFKNQQVIIPLIFVFNKKITIFALNFLKRVFRGPLVPYFVRIKEADDRKSYYTAISRGSP